MGRKTSRPSSDPFRPKPGPWSLDWSAIDREGPFAWPEEDSETFRELANFLAKLNLISLDEFFALERLNTNSAVHNIADDSLSPKAEERWAFLYKQRKMDSQESLERAFVSVTFCLAYPSDPRRVYLLYYYELRILRPLWWDDTHGVTGSSDKADSYGNCKGNSCYHSEFF